jgi:flagellar biosynthesis protein FlhA
LQETIKKHFDKILSRQSVKQLLENLKEDYPAVIEDISPDSLPLGTIQKVLQSLLKELIPIKDLVQILESLIDYSKVTKNIEVLTEYVRHSLGDTISSLYKDSNNVIHAAAIGENLEEYITNSLAQQGDATQTLGLTPEMLQNLNKAINKQLEGFKNLGYMPILITSATIRPYLFRLIHTTFPDIAILSFTELPANIEIEFIGKIEV